MITPILVCDFVQVTERPVFFMQGKCLCAVIDSQKMNFLLNILKRVCICFP